MEDVTYLEEFIRAEKGLDEMLSSMGLLTEGMGMCEMPESYRRRCNSLAFLMSGW